MLCTRQGRTLAQTLESLVSINQQLQQPDTAEGILTYAQQMFGMAFHEEWYEKLEKWDEALDAYTRRCDEDPNNIDLVFGRLTCLHALGEWDELSALAEEHWPHVSMDMRRKISPLAAAASWGMAEWEAMDDYISVMKHDSADRAWFRAVLNVHRGQFTKATQHISKARDLLDGELTALVGESYNRAYRCALPPSPKGVVLMRLLHSQIVRVQMLAELEEIIQYKESWKGGAENHERRVVIQKTWMRRCASILL